MLTSEDLQTFEDVACRHDIDALDNCCYTTLHWQRLACQAAVFTTVCTNKVWNRLVLKLSIYYNYMMCWEKSEVITPFQKMLRSIYAIWLAA